MTSSCGACVGTTNEYTRVLMEIGGDRSGVIIIAQRNIATAVGIYYLFIEMDTYIFERLAGNITLNIDSYAYSSTDYKATIKISGLYSWASFDAIGHKVVSLTRIT